MGGVPHEKVPAERKTVVGYYTDTDIAVILTENSVTITVKLELMLVLHLTVRELANREDVHNVDLVANQPDAEQKIMLLY